MLSIHIIKSVASSISEGLLSVTATTFVFWWNTCKYTFLKSIQSLYICCDRVGVDMDVAKFVSSLFIMCADTQTRVKS